MSASHKLAPYTLSIARGDGLVARFGDVVMYIAEPAASTDRLLATIHSVADTEHPGGVIAQQLAELVFRTGSDKIAPFGIIAPTAEGLLVLLRGNVIATIDAVRGTRELSGQRAFTWVDEIVPAPVRQIAIAGGSAASTYPYTDLRAGVVPGGGFVLCAVGASGDRPPQTESVAAETMRGQDATLHLESPIDTAPAGRPSVETATSAPVAGYLAAADGAAYPLDRNYVIGRDPLRDEAVRNSVASPIVVTDDQHISRVHAYVSIDGAAVFVRDAATPGGTFMAAPGAADWTQIGTTPTVLEPGWSLRVGDRIMTYHTGIGGTRPS